ncbi:MAG: hypothetical protein KKD01_19615 [Proteobacteria bacterium]|nr:hypothetical protein [Pseudomonadota bacterium]
MLDLTLMEEKAKHILQKNCKSILGHIEPYIYFDLNMPFIDGEDIGD